MIRPIHYNVGFIKGSEGQSPVASAAYRSGEELYSEKLGMTFSYKNKEDVLHTETSLSNNAPAKFLDRGVLWNNIELGERQSNGQYARSITADFDRGLSTPQMIEMARRHVREQFTAKGMIADWAIHNSIASDGGDNPHIHIMLTMKDIKGDGFGTKNRSWNDKSLAKQWRKSWADLTNEYLEGNGSEERVTEKSFKELGIDKMATVHLGVDASAMERKGIKTRLGDINRVARATNDKLKTIKGLIWKLAGGIRGNTTKYLLTLPSRVQVRRKSMEEELELSTVPDRLIDSTEYDGKQRELPDNEIDR